MEEERKVKTEDGIKLADEYGFLFFETSAKNDININETFEDLVEEIDKVHSKLDVNNSGIIVKNKLYKGNSKNGCC